jgi:AcrR family transcriptional regulator
MPRSSYHHGELKAALLQAAIKRLETQGASSLSLRSLARDAGVSPMAPYHHYGNHDGLIAAIAAEGFIRLQQRKMAALASASSNQTADERLCKGGCAYVSFVLDNPNLYRLMGSVPVASRSKYPELEAAAKAPAASLNELVETRFGEALSIEAKAEYAHTIWALVHGIGLLAIDGRLTRAQALVLADRGIKGLLQGWDLESTKSSCTSSI